MIRRALLIGCVLALPALATAQRGGGSKATKKEDLFAQTSTNSGPTLRVRDLEDMSPIHLFLDKKKDLKLSDAQVNALKDSEGKLKDRNAPAFKAVDSLIHEMQRPATNNADQEKVRMVLANEALDNALGQVYANYDSTAKDAMSTFDADARTKAADMMAKQRADGRKTVAEKRRSAGSGAREP